MVMVTGGRQLRFGEAPRLVASQHQQWVDNPVCRAPAAINRHGDGVDQKRHVIVHYLDDRVLIGETVFCQIRIKNTNPHVIAGRALIQTQVCLRYRQQLFGAARLKFVRISTFKIGCNKLGQFACGAPAIVLGVAAKIGKCDLAHSGLLRF